MWLFPLQSVLRKVNPQDALQIAPLMMQALLQMLNPSSGAKIVGGVQEDALMAIGTLVESMSMNEKKWIKNIGNWIERSANLIGIMCWVSLQHKFDLKSQVWFQTKNCTTKSLISTYLHPFWNCKIQSHKYRYF